MGVMHFQQSAKLVNFVSLQPPYNTKFTVHTNHGGSLGMYLTINKIQNLLAIKQGQTEVKLGSSHWQNAKKAQVWPICLP